MIMISSVSVHESFRLTSEWVAKGIIEKPSNAYFLNETIKNVIIAFVMLTVFSKIPFRIFERYAKLSYIIAVVLLIAVFPFGSKIKGAIGWFTIPWLPSIQPVEFAKLALILYLAYFLKVRRAYMSSFTQWFVWFFGIVSVIVILLIFQPDFGSILIIAGTVLFLYFIGGWSAKYLFRSLIAAIILAASIWGIGHIDIRNENGKNVNKISYISTRIDSFFIPNKEIALSSDGKTHQIREAFNAIGSGGFWGLGFGNSIQKFGYLPEVQGDFIFAVIVEELWFVGGFMVVSLYMFFMYRWFLIARSVQDLFAKYTAVGISLLVGVQAFVNIWVNLNTVPLTGVTLPFISYGGSSIMSLSIAAGILLSISRHTEYKPQNLSEMLQSRRKVTL